MHNDCVLTAFQQYARYLGRDTKDWSDKFHFWSTRWGLDGTLPSHPTKLKNILDLITKMGARKHLYISRIEMQVYEIADLDPRGSVVPYAEAGRIYYGISLTTALYFSLDSQHAYFSQQGFGKDWVCMAIELRRFGDV